MRKKRNYWTKEKSFEVALKYGNKRDFKKNCAAAYESLRKNGWLNSACTHMINIAHPIKWTKELCRKEALKYNTKIEFKKKCSWGYVVAKQNGWLDEITSHVVKYKHIQPTKWTKEMCYAEASKFMNRNEFHLNSTKAYAASVRNKWLNDVCKHMNTPYENRFKWSKEQINQISLNYTYRKDFQRENRNAYYSALHNGWLDDVCKHMTYQKLPNGYWHNFDNCKAEALKYSTKTEFVRGSQHVYNIALKYKWIDDICGHMKPIGDRYNKCIYSYEFSDNHVYVGLTRNIEIREQSRRKNNNDAVTKHINETGLQPIRKLLTEYIPVDMAIILEGEYLKKYINSGWKPLNRSKTGGIGSQSNKKYMNK